MMMDQEEAASAAPYAPLQEKQDKKQEKQDQQINVGLGIVLVLLLAANSVLQAEYDQAVYSSLDYSSYYFLVYFTASLTALLFPVAVCLDLAWYYAAASGRPARGYASARLRPLLEANPGYSLRAYARASVPLSALNFFGSYAWYMSLDLTPVSVNSPLFRASAMLLVFALSVLFLGERAAGHKLAAVALCVLGVALVGWGNYRWPATDAAAREGRGGTARGYALILLAAALWAVYEVVFRLRVGRANAMGVTLLVSMQGVAAFAALWAGVPLVAGAGLEPWPDLGDRRVVAFLWANWAFAATYYLMYGVGMAVTSPTFMTVAGTLGVPAAGAADVLLHGAAFSAASVAGMVCTVAGVLVMSLGEVAGRRLRRRRRRHPRVTPATAAAAAT